MTEDLETLYNEIANDINDAIEDQWKKAWLEVEMEDDNGELTGKYIDNDSNEKYFECEYETYKRFRQLWENYKSLEKGPWDRAIFTLTPNGEFTIDFEYNDQAAAQT